MHAEQAPAFRVADHFHEAIWLSDGKCAAVGSEREHADLSGEARSFCFGIGVADGCDFWIGEDHGWHCAHVINGFHSGNRFRSNHALFRAFVREKWLTGDVADSVDMRNIRAALSIDDQEAFGVEF